MSNYLCRPCNKIFSDPMDFDAHETKVHGLCVNIYRDECEALFECMVVALRQGCTPKGSERIMLLLSKILSED